MHFFVLSQNLTYSLPYNPLFQCQTAKKYQGHYLTNKANKANKSEMING